MSSNCISYQIRVLSLFAILSAISACSGGGSGGGDGDGEVTDPSLLNGIWDGTANSSDPTDETAQVYALIYNGDVIIRSKTSIYANFDAGTYAVAGNTFVMNVEGYDTTVPETVYSTLEGTYSTKSSINGTYTNSSGDGGGFSLVYQNIYERDSSLSKVTGSWLGGAGQQLFITADGSISGGDSVSCAWAGTISVIDPVINFYDVSMDFSNCDDTSMNGAWSGFATVEDDAVIDANDVVRVLVSQDAGSLAGGIRFFRQP